MENLGWLRGTPEVEGQLTLARGQQVPQDGTERRTVGQFGIGLTDDRQVGETEHRFTVQTLRTDQSPLLHVPQLIVADMLVPLEDLATRSRGRSGK